MLSKVPSDIVIAHQALNIGESVRPKSRNRRALRRARGVARTGILSLATHAADWNHLYASLTARRGLGSMHQFAPEHVDTLAALSGCVSCYISWPKMRFAVTGSRAHTASDRVLISALDVA